MIKVIIYPADNEIKLVQSVASASTLISSVTGEIREYITSKFPMGFFKSVYIDTAETVQAQNRNAKYNMNLNKIQFPNMAISPSITLDDPIEGMDKSLHMSSPNVYLRKDMRRNYKKLIVDPTNTYSIYYTNDYITTNFNFRITVNKFIQNMDLAYYIKSRFQIGMFQFLNDRYLNAEIPKSYIRIIAEILGLDINDSSDMDRLRLHLISKGLNEQMILKKINAMTGKDCFFVNEKSNFLVNVTDLDAPSSIIRESMSEGEYQINFRVQVSTWLPNSFIMSINLDKFRDLSTDTIYHLTSDSPEQNEGFYSIAIENIKLNRKDAVYFETQSGDQVIGQEIFHSIFTYDINQKITDIHLWQYLKADLLRIHSYMIDRNIEVRDLMHVKMFNRTGQLLSPDVIINYDDLEIKVIDAKGQDFVVSIYVNRSLFESVKKAIESDRFFFSENALATMIIKHYVYEEIDGVETPVLRDFVAPIYSFSSERDMYGSASIVNGILRTNVLRVMTAYGPGFIGLVDEGAANASNYKICIGFTSDNQPIIKALEKI
jgi:hypothetical protein